MSRLCKRVGLFGRKKQTDVPEFDTKKVNQSVDGDLSLRNL